MVAKRTLQELIRNEELGNKKCVDCGNPNPQWATVRLALLNCAVRVCVVTLSLQLCGVLVSTMCWSAQRIRGSHQVSRVLSATPSTSWLTITESFVRSVSMDTWQEEQIKRMQVCLPFDQCIFPMVSQVSQLGGNKPFKEFMKSYPADQSGYTEGMSAYDTYHSWAATQYREKVR